jgi:hypothetical protein
MSDDDKLVVNVITSNSSTGFEVFAVVASLPVGI